MYDFENRGILKYEIMRILFGKVFKILYFIFFVVEIDGLILWYGVNIFVFFNVGLVLLGKFFEKDYLLVVLVGFILNCSILLEFIWNCVFRFLKK